MNGLEILGWWLLLIFAALTVWAVKQFIPKLPRRTPEELAAALERARSLRKPQVETWTGDWRGKR